LIANRIAEGIAADYEAAFLRVTRDHNEPRRKLQNAVIQKKTGRLHFPKAAFSGWPASQKPQTVVSFESGFV
jgi:hypothetical protein